MTVWFNKERKLPLILQDARQVGKTTTVRKFAEFNNITLKLMQAFNKPIRCLTEGQSEIEFLLEYSGKIIPIEVKSANRTKSKSLDAYIKRYSPEIAIKFGNIKPSYVREKRVYNLLLYMAGELDRIL